MPESTNITPPPGPASAVAANGATPPVSDQEKFDEVVDRDSKIVLGILAGVAVLAALVMSTVALVQSSNTHSVTVTRTVTAAAVASAATPAVAAKPISLAVEGSSKKGPDGKMHDAFTKTEFAVTVGQPTQLKIDNKDDVPHSITSAEAGVSIMVMPGVHTYTINATSKGRFEWVCIIPCDSDANGWAMTHPGYMAGYITAT
jgi:heme/copper-type cytochrome/quinol oxidase subunit 2